MLDVKTEQFLYILRNLCPVGSYSVISVDEINVAHGEAPFTRGEVQSAISSLVTAGLINLRYNDGDDYCLCILPEGRSYTKSASNNGFFVRNKGLITSASSAFLGALVGALLSKIIC